MLRFDINSFVGEAVSVSPRTILLVNGLLGHENGFRTSSDHAYEFYLKFRLNNK